MKKFCKKGLRITRTAAAVSALLLAGSMFAGCDDSKNWINDGVKLEITEEGDLASGKPYKIKANRQLQELRADHGEISTVNPVTEENAGANEWFYVLPEEYFASYDLDYNGLKNFTETFRATLADGRTRSVKKNFAVTDPLLPDQWHIYNIGQNPYGVSDAPLRKIDLNVIPAWRIVLPEEKKQLDGSGIYAGVWDTPVDLNHEDLKDRIYDPGIPGTADIVNIGLSLEELKEDESKHHGTSVAGIIAASAMNRLGGRGVAFNALVTSFSMDAEDSQAMSAMLKMDHLNLVNASIGTDLHTYYAEALWDLFEALYEKNIAVIHSLGNDFEAGHNGTIKPYSTSHCRTVGADCEFKQTDNLARYPFVINVGALNSLGIKASYGSTGANMWVTGFGGEYGADTTDPDPSSAAMVTTLTSYDPKDFDDTDKNSPWRSEENKYYTNTMNGTSSAAPSTSGPVALAYQARPDITVSQLRYILAKTARNDTVMPTLALEPLEGDNIFYDEKVVYDYGWQDNAAGFRFSNWYGFGVVDTAALAKAALSCDEDPVCAGMAELPEVYISANEKPCAYTDDSKRLITCEFSDFQTEESSQPLGRNELIVDALTYDVSGLKYLPEGIITETCELAASAEDEEPTQHYLDRKHALFQANALLELIAESQSGTKSLLKPVYANWDYNSGLMDPDDDDDDDDDDYDDDDYDDIPEDFAMEPLSIGTSAFYQESLKEDPAKKYRLSFRSACQIDVDTLNKNMHLTVYGRMK